MLKLALLPFFTMFLLVHNLLMNFQCKRNQMSLPTKADHGWKNTTRLLGQQLFLKKNSKWQTKLDTQLTQVKNIHNIKMLSLNQGQSTQNCTKMLRNLTFVVQLAYFCIRPSKETRRSNTFV